MWVKYNSGWKELGGSGDDPVESQKPVNNDSSEVHPLLGVDRLIEGEGWFDAPRPTPIEDQEEADES